MSVLDSNTVKCFGVSKTSEAFHYLHVEWMATRNVSGWAFLMFCFVFLVLEMMIISQERIWRRAGLAEISILLSTGLKADPGPKESHKTSVWAQPLWEVGVLEKGRSRLGWSRAQVLGTRACKTLKWGRGVLRCQSSSSLSPSSVPSSFATLYDHLFEDSTSTSWHPKSSGSSPAS